MTDKNTTPDVIDRMFDFIASEPHMARALQAIQQEAQVGDGQQDPASILQNIKDATRAEFGGERAYIRKNLSGPAKKKVKTAADIGQRVMALFNGRNATEVARRLQIGRATVYRHLRKRSTS